MRDLERGLQLALVRDEHAIVRQTDGTPRDGRGRIAVVSGRDLHASLYQVVHVMPERPSSLAEIDLDVDAVLAIGLAKDPADLIGCGDVPRSVPIERALHLFGELCNAVGALHEQTLLHRDLKPENVFVVDGKHRWVSTG